MSLYYAHTVSCLYSTQIYTAQENTLYLGTWQKALGIGSPPSLGVIITTLFVFC